MSLHERDRALAAAGPQPTVMETAFARYSGSEIWVVVVGGAMVIALSWGFFVFASSNSADTWVPMLVGVSLVLISLPIIHLCSGRPTDRRLRRILLLALLLKLGIFTGARYYMSEGIYKGEGDAARYDQAGAFLIQNLREEGQFDIKGAELTSFPKETRVVGYITGVLYMAFGTSYFGGYLVFSWLAWLGLLFFFRSFQVARPNAPPYRAAVLILLFPSMLFWPSSLGKEGLMVFLIGLLTLGAARLLCGSKPILGVLWIALAGVGMASIRPHLLLIASLAMAASALASPNRDVGRRGGAIRLVLVLLMVPMLVSSIGRMDSVFGTTAGGSESLTDSFLSTTERTEIGGSAFKATPVRTPLDFPFALVTVLFRPFIFEAGSLPVLVSALEGTILLILFALSAKWIWRIGPAMYRSGFAAFCGAYVVAFIIAFSTIGNAGILSRQRVQMFPLLMLLVCIAYEQHRLEMLDAEGAPAPPVPTGLSLARSTDSNLSIPAPTVNP